MKNDIDKALQDWHDALNLSTNLETTEEKQLATQFAWSELCKVSKQILYKAHITGGSGVKYKSDEEMRRLIGLSPKH